MLKGNITQFLLIVWEMGVGYVINDEIQLAFVIAKHKTGCRKLQFSISIVHIIKTFKIERLSV